MIKLKVLVPKMDGFLSFNPPWKLFFFFFADLKKKSHLVYDQTHSSGAVFSLLYGYLYCQNSTILKALKMQKRMASGWSTPLWATQV